MEAGPPLQSVDAPDTSTLTHGIKSISHVELPSYHGPRAPSILAPLPRFPRKTRTTIMVQNFLRNVAKTTAPHRESTARLPTLLHKTLSKTRNKLIGHSQRVAPRATALACSNSITSLVAQKPPRVVPFAPEPTLLPTSSQHRQDDSVVTLNPGATTNSCDVIGRARAKSVRERLTESMLERIPQLHERRSRLLDQVAMGQRHKKVLSQYQIRLRSHRVSAISTLVIYVPHMIYPTSRWYRVWRLVLVLLTYYQLVTIPYNVAFLPLENPRDDTMGLLTNVFFAIDLVINLNTAVRVSDVTFITTRRHIARIYLHSWYMFVPDALSIVPWDVLVYAITHHSSPSTLPSSFASCFKLFRLPRILRMYSLVRILRYLRVPDEYKRWVLYSRYAHLIRLLSLLALFMFLVHLLACLWYGLVVPELWIETTSASSTDGSLLSAYTLSAYYIVTTVTGQSNVLQTNAQYVFSAVVIILGSLWIAVVFGNVGNLIANYYANQDLFQQKMESLFSSMTLLHLPVELQNRIVEYYQTMYTRHGTLNGKPFQFTKELSKNLSVEVGLFLRMNMITRSPMFQPCSPEFVQELVMQLGFQVYLGNDYIVVRGEVGSEMYFVQNGICEMRQPKLLEASFQRVDVGGIDLKPYRTLEEGDHFGELALLMNVKHAATVKAVTFLELCVLTRDVFLAVTDKYCDDKTVIENFIVEKYDPAVMESLLAIQSNPKQEHQRSITQWT
ncbi:hypothetical protein SDRG_07963 [Saprolegnia diclina VS20]|uniref:Cyclic nucleotide-binding domain-containing protein n=1 Tax=Saprolegnia diclina (strain VS20) TaxID=1156394 RepID=T0RWC7_SAPDV|nr:hypothetical protein SDRG_07963 [Saprolegnia diclina VS20]EQC34642.1 hypothetical protein SDRG_07963 [Saprolegnia diclina VS20]|eukprot:XP_008612048.1 hypothetical protein SDRG_07963 [Saprolegnia diclina VS20]